MGKMFFSNSSMDYFKREPEPVIPQKAPKKKRVKKGKEPPQMKVAKEAKTKEKVIKNKDGTITLQKIDKGGFTQTINIYTGRQRATGVKAKGQNSIQKESPLLFTPSGRPDFNKFKLYQSSFYNQLIDDRLKKLKDKEDGKLEAPESTQAILDKARDNMRDDLERLEDRQYRTLRQIQDRQADTESHIRQFSHDLIRSGRTRVGSRVTNRRTDSEASGSEHQYGIRLLSQREKERLREQYEEAELRLEEVNDPQPETDEEVLRNLGARGVASIIRRIKDGNIRRGTIESFEPYIGDMISQEEFRQLQEEFDAYVREKRDELDEQIAELQAGDIASSDLETSDPPSAEEYLRIEGRKLTKEQSARLHRKKLDKKHFYSETLGRHALYGDQATPDYGAYLGHPETLTDVEVVAVKLGINPLEESGEPKDLETLTDEIGEAGAKRQVANYEENIAEHGDTRLASQRARQARPQGIPSTTKWKELVKAGGDIASKRDPKHGVVTAVKDYRKKIGGGFRTLDADLRLEQSKLTTASAVIDKYFLGDQKNIVGKQAKAEIDRLFNDGKMNPRAYREINKLRKELKGVEKERHREAKVQAQELRRQRSEIDEAGSVASNELQAQALEELEEARHGEAKTALLKTPQLAPQPEPEPKKAGLTIAQRKAIQEQAELAEEALAQPEIEIPKAKTTPPFHQEALAPKSPPALRLDPAKPKSPLQEAQAKLEGELAQLEEGLEALTPRSRAQREAQQGLTGELGGGGATDV
tara:strand:+ start:1934 stop:4210 length:2277 start_codon:yes stop_codon:yes gene_type:complete